MRRFGLTILVVTLSSPSWAQPVVDGTLDAEYGAAIVVQTVETQFGDGNPSGGSELDAAYATIVGDRLYLMLTGNQEQNFNGLEIFIDSRAGGENPLSNLPAYGFLLTSQNLGGMTFDTGFEADFHLFSRWGPGPAPYEADFVDRQGGGVASVPGSTGDTPAQVGLQAAGSILAGNVGPDASGTALTQNLDFAINNNNIAGVAGGTAAANAAAAAAVTTGMEFSIALADLGNPGPGSTIKIFAAIDNGDHNYLSNQLLAGLPAGTGNLGGDGGGGFTGTLSGVDLTDFAGAQYFTLQLPGPPPSVVEIPALSESGAALLAVLLIGGGVALLARRRGSPASAQRIR